jgi:hypothetical protein
VPEVIAENVFEEINALNERWKVLEDRLANIIVEVDEDRCPISSERLNGGRIRLMYKGKPITDCCANDKIDAAYFVSAFVDKRDKVLVTMKERASKSVRLLDHIIKRTEKQNGVQEV